MEGLKEGTSSIKVTQVGKEGRVSTSHNPDGFDYGGKYPFETMWFGPPPQRRERGQKRAKSKPEALKHHDEFVKKAKGYKDKTPAKMDLRGKLRPVKEGRKRKDTSAEDAAISVEIEKLQARAKKDRAFNDYLIRIGQAEGGWGYYAGLDIVARDNLGIKLSSSERAALNKVGRYK